MGGEEEMGESYMEVDVFTVKGGDDGGVGVGGGGDDDQSSPWGSAGPRVQDVGAHRRAPGSAGIRGRDGRAEGEDGEGE